MNGPASKERHSPHPSDSIALDRLTQALNEFYEDVDADREPDRERLFEKYKDVADELADCLRNLDFIQNVAPQLGANSDSSTSSDSGTQSSPVHLGDFSIVREIGRGGMGVVYEAEQLSLARRVALKVLPFAAILDERQLGRFKNEAQAAANAWRNRITSPSLGRVKNELCEFFGRGCVARHNSTQLSSNPSPKLALQNVRIWAI